MALDADSIRRRLTSRNGQARPGGTAPQTTPAAPQTQGLNYGQTRTATPPTGGPISRQPGPTVSQPPAPVGGPISRRPGPTVAENIPQAQTNTQPQMSPYGQQLTGPVAQEQWGALLSANQGVAQQIAQIFNLRYGMIPGGQATLVSLVNKVVNEGYPMEAIQQLIDQGYNQSDIFRQASDAVSLEYGPQEAAARRAIEEILRQSQRDIDIGQNAGRLADQMLQSVYGQTGSQFDAIRDRITAGYNTAGTQIQEGGEAAMGSLRNFMNSGAEQIAAGAERAGAGDATASVLDRAEGRAAPGAQLMASNMGNSLALNAQNSATQNANSEGLRRALGLSESSSRASSINEMVARIGDILNQRNEAVIDQEGLISDIYSQRGAAMRNAIDELTQQQREHGRQDALDAATIAQIEAGIAATEAGIDQNQQRLDLDQQAQIHDQLMDIRRFGLESEQSAASIALIGAQIQSSGVQDEVARAQIQQIMSQIGLTEAEQERIMAEIDNIRANTANTNADTDQTNAITGNIQNPAVDESGNPIPPAEEAPPTEYLPGIRGANDYMADNNVPAINLESARNLIDLAQRILVHEPTNPTYNLTIGIPHLDQVIAQLANSYGRTENLGAVISQLIPLVPQGLSPPGTTGSQIPQLDQDHIQAIIEILLAG